MCAAKVEPKAHYTAKDFKRYARKDFPEQFAVFRDTYTCRLEDKTYLDENHTAHGTKALLVGHYHTRQGGPQVWAQATPSGVRYFSGKPNESLCVPVPEQHVSRIYYGAPYNVVHVAQEGGSRTAGRKAGHYFVETIINVLFLLAGQIEQVSNPGQTDMLGNFRYVCMNFVQKPEVQERCAIPTHRRSKIPLPQNTLEQIERENKKRKRASNDYGQRIKQEDDSDEDRFVQHASSHSPVPYGLASRTQQTSLLDQIRNYEADMESKREREKQSHMEEVKALQSKLAEQEQRAQDAEEKAMKERKKRKRAEEQVANLQGQLAARGEKPIDSDVETIGTPKSIRGLNQNKDVIRLSKRLSNQKKELARLSQYAIPFFACAPPISSGGKKSPIQDIKVPFCYAAARTEPGSNARNAKAQRERVRELSRERLALLVKLVFLLTDRVANLVSDDEEEDLLLQFKDVCIHIQQKKSAEEASRQISSRSEDAIRSLISTTSTSVDADATETDIADVGGIRITSGELAIHNSRRAAPGDDRSMSDIESSSKPTTSSKGEMIVSLEGEVKQWKEKFEKLNKKVQDFMKDD
ncbi:hypothetical protein E8E12_002990 [Didymella heteroderae]|uniref:Uncharacterized protein n=1 Tax=Didymella heteroderae TaxID=1769908 RepID=A0A9P4WIF2_9PLEO|nr:hypothetical protein E8E12_002990 [Didymella heteroderae]